MESLKEAVESYEKRNVINQKLKLVTQKKEWALVSETQASGNIRKYPLGSIHNINLHYIFKKFFQLKKHKQHVIRQKKIMMRLMLECHHFRKKSGKFKIVNQKLIQKCEQTL